MNKRSLCAIVIIMSCFLFSCTGNKEKGFVTEIRILKETTNALTEYKKQIENTNDVKQVARANKELLNKMKKLSPQIEVVTKNHPEWQDNPPDEVGEYVAMYIEENKAFTTDTLKIVTDFVGKHSEDKDLADSFVKLKAFLSPKAQD